MITVRSRVHRWMQVRGLDTVFGSPGSDELPFLRELPEDVRYVLGLHEGVGMADGYAQATGRPVLAELLGAPVFRVLRETAPGTGCPPPS